ncbi:MAG: GAF domain-containing protein [Flammeovirgaceae bacterium]|nr:GAF domain-containing protein [Flammeovirgaceae bacterium]MBR06567.1 GAF domain-containing protein [Rickettsiales bacterium]HCX21107.1 GAF domain-containing protein [Cytophagales bacterium]|tara:strand:- start:26 stop:505 length:480 start_codon:yes stop_codon:yes gene_type:complete
MAEELHISTSTDKIEKYESLIPQIEALISGETDLVANLANIAAALRYGMDFFWVGFYMVKEDQLVLGPFQGPIACTRINKGKGVCGSVWEKGISLVVPNVDEFPGHIACSSDSKSEIVVPIKKDGEVIGVLDVDSDQLASFDDIDQKYLERLMNSLSNN